MPKEKRTFHAEVIVTPSLQLQRALPEQQKQPDQLSQQEAPRQNFAPELINRLAEKIKKL